MGSSAQVRLAGRPDLPARLGRVIVAGRVLGGRGLRGEGVRRYPAHALVLVTRGAGTHLDAAGRRRELGPGSLVVVRAGVPHWYGPAAGTTWDETFVAFAGPVFDLALSAGVLPAERVQPVRYWAGRLDAFRSAAPPRTPAEVDAEACRLLDLLVEAGAARDPAGDPAEDWPAASRRLLAADLARRLDPAEVAAAVGMPYETWRKAFARATGQAPAAYRAARRVEATAELLRWSALPLREVAALVGYADEHHLSRRFRAATGMSPRQFRRRPT